MSHSEKLRLLMEENPRLSSREYAKLAIEKGIVEHLDADELLIRETQKEIRSVVRSSKADPQLALVSLRVANNDGTFEEVLLPAKICKKAEAQRVLDNYMTRIEGNLKRALKLRDYWNSPQFGYQTRFHWG